MSTRTIRDITALVNETQVKLDKAKVECEQLQADLDSYQRTLEVLSERLEDEDEMTVPAKQIRNEMLAILREAGEPMHYGDIYDQLVHRGIRVPGKDPRRNVGAHLSNDERFQKHGSGYWGLASWGEVPSVQKRNVVSLRDRVRDGSSPSSVESMPDWSKYDSHSDVDNGDNSGDEVEFSDVTDSMSDVPF